MTEDKIWINVNSEGSYPSERQLENFTEVVGDFFEDRDVIVTSGEIETISGEEAQEFTEILKEALE